MSVEIALTKSGQKVSIEYSAGNTQLTNLLKFDNLDIPNQPQSATGTAQ
ncbi:MAG: hypothetical protein PW734_08270 [Verrucomicrobium sp.]|nr:hypothetical protein [Verrucomicrobium sp.]